MENNNQEIKLCPSCGAKNKSTYKFCNECGATLNQQSFTNPADNAQTPTYVNNVAPQVPPYGANGAYYQNQQPQNGYAPNYAPYGGNSGYGYTAEVNFDGVSAKDVYDFTGRKASFYEKLRTQHITGKNGPYCWPLFVLGLLLGFFGMGCWYLYHKMYKPAVGFIAAAVAQMAMAAYSVYFALDYVFNNLDFENLEGFLEEYSGGSAILQSDMFSSINPMMFILESASNLLSLAAFVLTIALPFFAYKQYKNFAIKQIRLEYCKNPQPQIALKGGTKGGLVTLASILYGIAYFVLIIDLVVWCVALVFEKAGTTYYEDDPLRGGYYEQSPFSDEDYDFDFDFDERW